MILAGLCSSSERSVTEGNADSLVDVDDQARGSVLVIHWRGGQHSELRVRKPRAGEHGCATTDDRSRRDAELAGRWSDEHIAASLNRMGIPTGQGKLGQPNA